MSPLVLRLLRLALATTLAVLLGGAVGRAGSNHAAADDAPPASDLGWQVHSWNDAREWPQLLRKTVLAPGADPATQRLFVKIDPHYMPAVFCDSQAPPLPRGNVTGGCMVLNHDRPSASVPNYSTADDVLAVIEQHIVVASGALNVSLALCFKSAPADVCAADPTDDARDWLGLVDGLLARAAALQARHPGAGVEIVLDGDGTPGGATSEARARTCLFTRWGAHPSTYIPTRDPTDALESSSGALASFAYLNPEAQALELRVLIAAGFGRFGRSSSGGGDAPDGGAAVLGDGGQEETTEGSTRPMTFWEPSDEPTVRELAEIYVAGPARMRGGFLFATNSDPVQHELYLAGTANGTGRAWHTPVVGAAAADDDDDYSVEGGSGGSGGGSGGGMLGSLPQTVLLRPSNRLLLAWQQGEEEDSEPQQSSQPMSASWVYAVSTAPLDDPAAAAPAVSPAPAFSAVLPLQQQLSDVAAVAAGPRNTVIVTSSNGTHVVLQPLAAAAAGRGHGSGGGSGGGLGLSVRRAVANRSGGARLLRAATHVPGIVATAVVGSGSGGLASAAAAAAAAAVVAPEPVVVSLWAAASTGGRGGGGCLLHVDAVGLSSGADVGSGCAVTMRAAAATGGHGASAGAEVPLMQSVSVAAVPVATAGLATATGCALSTAAAATAALLFTAADGDKTVLAGGLCATATATATTTTAVTVARMPALARPLTPIGVGSSTTIRTTAAALGGGGGGGDRGDRGADADSVAVLETRGESFCWNMEARNKAASPRLCDSVPQPTPGVMTYTAADSVADWVRAVNGASGAVSSSGSATDTNTTGIGSCHDVLLHGAFGLGRHPAGAVFRSAATGRVVPVVVHEAWQGCGADRACTACGVPVTQPAGTLVLDAWTFGSNHAFGPLPQYPPATV